MDYNVINRKDPQIQDIFKSMDDMVSHIDKCIDNYQPYFKGDRFLTDDELSKKLNVSRRTLHVYRTEGRIPYIAFAGKVLYREKDIEKVLKDNYVPIFKIKTELL